MPEFTVNRLSDTGAAEVLGIDCSKPLDSVTLAGLKRAFLDNPILVIRDANFTAAQQAAFSRQFGPLEGNDRTPQYRHPDDPDVMVLSNEVRPDGTPVGLADAGDTWHSDFSYIETPSLATILQSIRNASRGGETDYCNMYLVYEALPIALKRKIEGRFAIHSPLIITLRHVDGLRDVRDPRAFISAVVAKRPTGASDYPGAKQYLASRKLEVKQPLVRTHPETGRQSLYINARFTISLDGMVHEESQPLLEDLLLFADSKRFHYRHKYRDGDLVMWDNRCLNHRATGGYEPSDIRRMHRTCVAGDKPFYRPG